MKGDWKRVVTVCGAGKMSLPDAVNGMEKSSMQLQLALCTVGEEGGNVLVQAFACCQL
jgi:hypothetical protein